MLRRSSCVVLYFIIGLLHQSAYSQCYITVSKNCGGERFTNSCSGDCDASKVLLDCGFHVRGNPALDYSSVEISQEIWRTLNIEELPFPRFCGVMMTCICLKNDENEYKCEEDTKAVANYWVHERQATGDDCDEVAPPWGHPIYIDN